MADVVHERHGVPLEAYELTRRDHASQKTSDQIRNAVNKQAEERQAKEAADPELGRQRNAHRAKALEMIRSFKNPDHQIMRWRVRLYCGHIVETKRHCSIANPTMHGSSSMRCPDCCKDPSVIVAYEPLGPVAEPPNARKPPAQAPKSNRLTRTQLEQRIAALEAENARLKTARGS
ncbi:hypothetical protein AB0D08_05100 [Kitasatospora sp. NPDC048540]|uniref:hypothetical protein n=1 Tax=Kitasatospora sp. NPDC048540 TaxID=3155634 RepID=UPI0033C22637